MNYETLESEIVARIAPLASADLSIVGMPESEAERKRALPTKARITVIYAGSEYDKTTSTGQNRNAENVFITLFIESTFLRGPVGIYNLIRVMKLAFSGYKPTNCQRLEPVKHHSIGDNPVEKRDNLWEYQMIFSTTALSIENFIEDISILVSQITLNGSNDDTSVIPAP